MIVERRGFLIGAAVAGALSGAARAARPDPANPVILEWVSANKFNGIIATGRRGKPDYSWSFGEADVEARIGLSRDTKFGVASISKWLVSITILRLVEQGKLDLDAPIARWLPDYRADTGGRVLLRHLLSNTSGIPNGFNAAVKADAGIWTRRLTTSEAIKAFCSGDLTFEPGAKFSYDLTNWIVVKGIVEAVTGEDMVVAVKRLTLDPLGMTNTLPAHLPAANEGLAAAYATIEPPVRKMFPVLDYMVASGGYVSNATDLLRAAYLVNNRRFLSASSLGRLTTVLVPEQDYALGGRVKTLKVKGKPRRFAWETGRRDGYRSLLAHRIDTGQTLIVLNNNDLSQKAIDELGYALFGATP